MDTASRSWTPCGFRAGGVAGGFVAAVARVVSTAYGMHRKEIPPEVVHLFGYSRIGEQMAERLDALIEQMIAQGRLEVQGAYLVVAED